MHGKATLPTEKSGGAVRLPVMAIPPISMKEMQKSRAAFADEIKRLIISSCDLSIDPDSIPEDAPLFGPESPFELDSIDALQITVAIQKKYGVSITDSKEMRRISKSLATLAAFVRDKHP